MNSTYFAIISAIIFFVFKFFEIRLIKKQQPQFKILIRDSLIAGVSVILGIFVYDQFHSLTIDSIKTPNVFVGEPEF